MHSLHHMQIAVHTHVTSHSSVSRVHQPIIITNNKLLTLFYHFYPHRLEEFKSKAHGAKADTEMCLLLLRALAPYAAPMTTVEELVEFLSDL